MAGHDIIVVGASAGGVEALRELVGGLPPNLAAALFVVMHVPPEGASKLTEILSRSGPLPVVRAKNGDKIRSGGIYVAIPDHHLLIEGEYILTVRGPRENRCRPAIDPLFRSAARYYGTRVIGVVLSGLLDDGTAGLSVIKQRGGIAIVQDPDEALYASMPNSAIHNVAVDHVVTLVEMSLLLADLAATPVDGEAKYPMDKNAELEAKIAGLEVEPMESLKELGTASSFTCPECHGVLFEVQSGDDMLRFRCQVGHAYSVETMIAEQGDGIERYLWATLRAIEERIGLAERLAARARDHSHTQLARHYEETVDENRKQASVLKDILLENNNPKLTETLEAEAKGA